MITGITVISATRLIPTVPVTASIQIEKEKQWAQFCLFWLRFINSECQPPAAGVWIDNIIGNLDIFNVFDPLLPDNYKQFITKTMQLLYLGQDLQKTEQEIIDIINTNDHLTFRLKRFLEWYNE
jgi:hypothetical protein